MFVDRIRVFAQAGNGGRGCVSFRREKFVPKGGPDGGDGGRGGDIVLRADQHTDHLAGLFYEPIIRAKSGEHGQGKKMHGKGAPQKTIAVPIGTIVYRAIPAEEGGSSVVEKEDAHLARLEAGEEIADLTHDGEEFLLVRGGAGGKGNVHFKSSRNRAPREYTEGGEGESGYFFLELRTIADAALVGYPNAGKSTLLRQLSAAQPKVAAYPFTTLHPVIGVVELGGYRRVTVADIPGLIEGAHRNLGLGHDFLRHITRCGLLIFVLDMAGSEGRSPIADFESLRREIDLYDARLSQKPWLVVANKMDLAGANENLVQFRVRFPQLTVAPVSGKAGQGMEQLKDLLDSSIPIQPVVARWDEANLTSAND
jgi:GTP-binding protein